MAPEWQQRSWQPQLGGEMEVSWWMNELGKYSGQGWDVTTPLSPSKG